MTTGSLNGSMPLSSDLDEALAFGDSQRMSFAKLGSRAGAGTVSSLSFEADFGASPRSGLGDQELCATVSTELLGGPGTTTIPHIHADFIFKDATGLGSADVASDARGDQVVGSVVESIFVQMIRDKASLNPVQLDVAPMAWMGGWPDLVVQDGPVLQDVSGFIGQRMSASNDGTVSVFRGSLVGADGSLILATTGRRTELADVGSIGSKSGAELFSTLNTVFYGHPVNLAQGGQPCLAAR